MQAGRCDRSWQANQDYESGTRAVPTSRMNHARSAGIRPRPAPGPCAERRVARDQGGVDPRRGVGRSGESHRQRDGSALAAASAWGGRNSTPGVRPARGGSARRVIPGGPGEDARQRARPWSYGSGLHVAGGGQYRNPPLGRQGRGGKRGANPGGDRGRAGRPGEPSARGGRGAVLWGTQRGTPRGRNGTPDPASRSSWPDPWPEREGPGETRAVANGHNSSKRPAGGGQVEREAGKTCVRGGGQRSPDPSERRPGRLTAATSVWRGCQAASRRTGSGKCA